MLTHGQCEIRHDGEKEGAENPNKQNFVRHLGSRWTRTWTMNWWVRLSAVAPNCGVGPLSHHPAVFEWLDSVRRFRYPSLANLIQDTFLGLYAISTIWISDSIFTGIGRNLSHDCFSLYSFTKLVKSKLPGYVYKLLPDFQSQQRVRLRSNGGHHPPKCGHPGGYSKSKITPQWYSPLFLPTNQSFSAVSRDTL